MLEVWPPQSWGFWCQIRFWRPKTLFCIRFFDPSNSLWDSQGGFSQKMKFSTFKPLLQSKNVRSMTPPKLGFLMPNKVLEAQKNFQKTPKMKKTVFLKNGPTNFFPTNIPDISEPHGDLLHWNFSWAFTFYISVYEEGSVRVLSKRDVSETLLTTCKWKWAIFTSDMMFSSREIGKK